jgi:pyridoxal phosphate enzyme (YggS family)
MGGTKTSQWTYDIQHQRMSIEERIASIRKEINESVTLVAVSKTKPAEAILDAYAAGQREFGENKVQELVAKHELLPKDIHWHLIGHLQSNKVKYIAPFVHLIHSVDSEKLLVEINKQALKCNRIIDCLLQFHVATEETKFGLNHSEALELLNSKGYKSMKNIRIVGIMGMASFTDDLDLIHQEFQSLKATFDALKSSHFQGECAFNELSMGMSGDYQIAIEEGSTMIRLGSTIFGSR